MSQQRDGSGQSEGSGRSPSSGALLTGFLFVMSIACGGPGADQPPPAAQQAVTQGIDLGYGPDLFYYLRHDPGSGNFSTFGTISTSGEVTDRFGVGLDFDALTFVARDLGYGPNLFYYLRHDPGSGNFSTFGTISTSGEVLDRFGVGLDFDALTFVPTSVGYGTNLFYYLERDTLQDPSQYFSTFGTISTSGAVLGRFGVGLDFDALTFALNDPPVAADLSVTLAEDGMANISLACTDAEGEPLSYIVMTPPQHGALSGTGATRTYAPAANYSGADRFEYRCNDGAADSNLAVVGLTVTPVNDPPSVPELSAPEDGARLKPGGISLSWLASSDVDGDRISYRVVIERGHKLELEVATSATELHLSGDHALRPGKYSWRVEAIDAASASSGFSAARTFFISGQAR